jgi:hypothetical protein
VVYSSTGLQKLKENWKSAFAVAAGGVILPFAGGYASALAYLCGHHGYLDHPCNSTALEGLFPAVPPEGERSVNSTKPLAVLSKKLLNINI